MSVKGRCKQFCKHDHDVSICGRNSSGQCKDCVSIADKVRYSTSPKTKEAKKATSSAYSKARWADPEGKAAQKATIKAWATTEEGMASAKASELKTRCKKACTTVDHYESLPKKCSFPGCTAIVAGGSGDWHMDHDKVTKTFRGLLCFKHNRQVGDLALDEAEGVVEYLQRHQIKKLALQTPLQRLQSLVKQAEEI